MKSLRAIALSTAAVGLLWTLPGGQPSVRALPAQASPGAARLPEHYAPRLAAFEEAVRKQMAADHTTGLAVALLVGDEIWARGFGLADVENGSPMKPESSFRLASITKPMTATAVLQLVGQGKMSLDAEIQTYVPYFPRKKHPVTVRQLLGHLGGISHYKNAERELHIKEHKDTREAIAIFEDFDLVAEPGTRYSYSTYGYNLLGAAIEGASGQSYGDYMRAHVWGPLGMTDTRLDDPRDIIPNRVRGYEWADGTLRNSEFVDVSSRFAGGGTRTTVLDLLKFARGLLDGKLLSKTSVDRMTESMILSDRRYTGYGMGWDIGPQNGRYILSHSGSQNETRTGLYLLPARHAAIAVATNFESGDLFWYVQSLVAQVFGESWDRAGGSTAYLPGNADRAQFAAVRDVFHYGLSAFERQGKRTTDPKKLREAFRFFDDCVNRTALAAGLDTKRKKCRDGLHPVTGEPLILVGSFMAQTLAGRGGAEALEVYHALGPVEFFADYAKASRSASGVPSALRLDADLEQQISRWRRDWPRTFNESTRGPAAVASWGFDAGRLRGAFQGTSIYPDYSRELGSLALRSCGGDQERALAAASLARELYPETAATAAFLAGTRLCLGDAAQARALLEEGRKQEDGARFVGPGFLNGMAYELASTGRLDGARELLRIAIELHPKEANLYDSLGELERKAGHIEASLAAYRKAVELDPKLESSINALEAIARKKR